MPCFLAPRRHTSHRIAVIALYKALLSGCSSAALQDEDRRSMRNAIQNKFRQNRKLQSPYQLGLAFRAGYETLDHLDTSTSGNTTSTSFLTSLISSLPRGMTCAPPASRPPRLPHPSKKQLACLPPEYAVLNVRPYQKVSGPRHVPILCSAGGTPFLRLKKPQPASLGRIIQQKTKKRIERFESRILLLNYWHPIAEQEDQWDVMMKDLGVRDKDDDGDWVDVIIDADRQNMWDYERGLAADRVVARKMQTIVAEETALALKEGQVIMRGRKGRPIHKYTKGR